MNKNALKTYAPRARRDFIAAVTARAAKFGVSPKQIEPIWVEGDFAIIGGTPFPRKVEEQRRLLEGRISAYGFAQVMEVAAYTWFNRFAAIRFMEIHGYLDHGYRVLSHPTGKLLPEIVEQADHVDLPGLNRDKVVELKLDGRKDEDLYRILLIAQCNALHAAMPFLFERIDDETELLLPDNLLHTDSLIRQMVAEIDEDDGKEIEIIGWLYQFYIAERKDEVIGKVVKSEDIPAATQLFTPNWIVKYMVQNSLGAKWLATYPNSSLRAKMEYYIEPAKQTDEVNRQLAEITPAELDPEKLTMIDPACGSGHIIVEGYDVFKEIYLERGYTLRQIPRLILEKNLYGIDIDDRAAQLAGFALVMKARADDRTILSLESPPRLNIIAIQESKELDSNSIIHALWPEGRELIPTGDLLSETLSQPVLTYSEMSLITKGTIRDLIDLFADGKTLGSLITVATELAQRLPALQALLVQKIKGDMLTESAHNSAVAALTPLLKQANLLSRRYNFVVANPPYIGGSYLNDRLKHFLSENHKDCKSDLFSGFVSRCIDYSENGNWLGFVTPFTWLYISSFKGLRQKIVSECHITSMVKPSYTAFYESAIVPLLTFVLRKKPQREYIGKYYDLGYLGSASDQPIRFRKKIEDEDNYLRSLAVFQNFDGTEFAFSMPTPLVKALETSDRIRDHFSISEGLKTGKNSRFIRFWHEIAANKFGELGMSKKWVPHAKGGDYRRWYGNWHWVVNWENEGREIKNFPSSGLQGKNNYGELGVSWSKISTSYFGVRLQRKGAIFDSAAPALFPKSRTSAEQILSLLSSNSAESFVKSLNPTMNFQVGNIGSIPLPAREGWGVDAKRIAMHAIEIAKSDWESCENSWDFTRLPLIRSDHNQVNLKSNYDALRANWLSTTLAMHQLEEENNSLFIKAYGLGDELSPKVPLSGITLYCNPDNRYGGDLNDKDREIRLRADTMRELISYAIGCMMGRYSLAEPGLIYADAGNEGFDPARYGAFPANDDGIVPITDDDWFADDAANQFVEFLKAAQSPESISENLKFVAEGLGAKTSETPLDTVRRYLSHEFFKDHLRIYKKRPIYWLFSSGTEKAFECLVYLHRYNAGTLSRMRMEYVVPLQGRMRGKIEQVDTAIKAASSTATQNKLRKELEKLKKKHAELVKFDEELRHFADQRIELDLDDGVKINYAKFGNLLSEVKKISGDSDE
jgi:hypothetical protein